MAGVRKSRSKKNEKTAQANALPNLFSNLSSQAQASLYKPTQQDTDDADEEIVSENYVDNLNSSIELIYSELRKIRNDFQKMFEENQKQIKILHKENAELKEKCQNLEQNCELMKQVSNNHALLINKMERHSRRSNLRIVGYKTMEGEDCLKIAQDVFAKVGVADCQLERAHRDGRFTPGRDRHILVKLSFFQDKLKILQNYRGALAQESYFIIDDLTKFDLQEKRKWAPRVKELFRQGTRLRFSAGAWRHNNGKPYDFTAA